MRRLSARVRRRLFFLESIIFLLSTTLCCTYALLCYECFDTGPTNKNCTRETHNCSGTACLLFESADERTSSAFCLLTGFNLDSNLEKDKRSLQSLKSGCWLDPKNNGKHCLCTTDFCNRLRDRTQPTKDDPSAPPLPELELLKENPLIDHEYIDDESTLNEGPTKNLTDSGTSQEYKGKSNGELLEVEHDSIGDEEDLVPIDFEAYEDEWLRRRPSPSNSRVPLRDEKTRYHTSNSLDVPVGSSLNSRISLFILPIIVIPCSWFITQQFLML
ncbi:hypothetical protein Ddc_02850 [Ditylenchus destructor]|nr:hypothetical protein Ddc_02850 [Ditylenchus destructor]